MSSLLARLKTIECSTMKIHQRLEVNSAKMRRILQEMRQFMQEALSQQAEEIAQLQSNLEEARTWATNARVTATKLRSDVKDSRGDIEDMKDEIKEVLQVHRDRMDGIQQDLNERDDWAHTIQTIVDGLDTN